MSACAGEDRTHTGKGEENSDVCIHSGSVQATLTVVRVTDPHTPLLRIDVHLDRDAAELSGWVLDARHRQQDIPVLTVAHALLRYDGVTMLGAQHDDCAGHPTRICPPVTAVLAAQPCEWKVFWHAEPSDGYVLWQVVPERLRLSVWDVYVPMDSDRVVVRIQDVQQLRAAQKQHTTAPDTSHQTLREAVGYHEFVVPAYRPYKRDMYGRPVEVRGFLALSGVVRSSDSDEGLLLTEALSQDVEPTHTMLIAYD